MTKSDLREMNRVDPRRLSGHTPLVRDTSGTLQWLHSAPQRESSFAQPVSAFQTNGLGSYSESMAIIQNPMTDPCVVYMLT